MMEPFIYLGGNTIMTFDRIRSDILHGFNENGVYPTQIRMNKNVLIPLKEAGHINLAAGDPSKITFMGIYVTQDNDIPSYEIS